MTFFVNQEYAGRFTSTYVLEKYIFMTFLLEIVQTNVFIQYSIKNKFGLGHTSDQLIS